MVNCLDQLIDMEFFDMVTKIRIIYDTYITYFKINNFYF